MRSKSLLLCGAFVGVAISGLAGCGSGTGDASPAQSGFAGKWHATLSGGWFATDLLIDVELRQVSDGLLTGTMSTNAARCFNNAQASALTSKTSLTSLSGQGSGTASMSTYITISGELAEGKITGLFKMFSGSSGVTECDIDTFPITLARP